MANTEVEKTESFDPREQILSGVRKGHSVTLGAFKTVVDRVAPVTSKIPTVSVPGASKIPSREAVTSKVSGTREFAGQLREEQRKFNDEFLKTAAGLHPAFSKDDSAEA